jgi:hypothetical protein
MMPPRRPPFDHWPVQHIDPKYGYVWYLGKGVIVSHITVTHGSDEAARAYHQFEEMILADYAEEVRVAGGIFVIHDWRALESYDASARAVWQQKMRQRPKGYLRGSVVCVARANALLKMAVQAANVVASVTHGAKVDLTTDLAGALERYGAKRPKSIRPSGDRLSVPPDPGKR